LYGEGTAQEERTINEAREKAVAVSAAAPEPKGEPDVAPN
jgi:hypothetical protein